MLPRPDLIQLLTHATVFVCPSVYEPLGIVNLEAMACETAVVATHTGGIPEVVEEGVTGLLVPLELRDDGSGEPVDPAEFAARLLGADQRAPRRPGRGRAPRQGRPRARGRRVRLVGDRRARRRSLRARDRRRPEAQQIGPSSATVAARQRPHGLLVDLLRLPEPDTALADREALEPRGIRLEAQPGAGRRTRGRPSGSRRRSRPRRPRSYEGIP